MSGIRVALLDSGVEKSLDEKVRVSAAFLHDPVDGVTEAAAIADQLGHGTALAKIISSVNPDVQFLIGQLFTEKLVCTPQQVASALDWAVCQGAQLINMSFGLSHNRAVLHEACERALAADVILVAASPAQGAAVFPAAYPGVIRATGDARCLPDEVSFLDSAQADFGAHVHSSVVAIAGASVGCAHVSAKIASGLGAGIAQDRSAVIEWLAEQARYRGRERRS